MSRPIHRLSGLLSRPATGAVLGQVSQAVAGLALQVAAARTLGASGLATFSLVYGAVVLVTAVSSGLVGDSLTVLDRAERGLRAGLHGWAVLVAAGAGLVAGVGAALSDLVPGWAAVVLGLAVSAYVVEDLLRRLLMATGRFWSLPLVDGTSLVAAMGALLLCALAGPLTLASFAVALLAGQSAAGLLAWWQVPAPERPRGPWSRPDLAGVWGFGVWRAASQVVRPTLMTGLRLVVIAVAGSAAYGPMEVARVYTAPTLVVVAGMGSYLLPHYVATRDRPAGEALRAADRAALLLAGAVALIGVCAVVLQPVAEPLLTGGDYAVPVAAVVGWSAYAVASALLLPYSGVATVHRRQRRVLALRLLEFVALPGVWALTALAPRAADWVPLVLAVGPVVVAVAVRATVLRPLSGTGEPAVAEPVAG